MKYLSYLLIATLTLISCNPEKTHPMAASDSEKLIQQYFSYFNNHEWAKMAAMYAPIAAFKDPSLGPGIVPQTRQQIIDKYSELSKMFPDIHDKVLQVYPSGDNHIIVEFVSSGTAPDQSTFELPICTIFTIEGGFITKDFTYYDNFEDGENNKQP